MTIKSSLRQDLLVLDATDRRPVRSVVVAHARVTTVEAEAVRVAEARTRRPIVAVDTTIVGIATAVPATTRSREKYLGSLLRI